jgi:hypothetical protein
LEVEGENESKVRVALAEALLDRVQSNDAVARMLPELDAHGETTGEREPEAFAELENTCVARLLLATAEKLSGVAEALVLP